MFSFQFEKLICSFIPQAYMNYKLTKKNSATASQVGKKNCIKRKFQKTIFSYGILRKHTLHITIKKMYRKCIPVASVEYSTLWGATQPWSQGTLSITGALLQGLYITEMNYFCVFLSSYDL